MKPQTVGRVLGVGLRVAGRMAGQRIAGSTQSAVQASATAAASPTARRVAQNVQNVQRAGGSVARGMGGFLRPFQRVGGIVFLEVAGVFFLLFVLVFGQMVWRLRDGYAAGPDHAKFLAAVILMLIFVYLSISSFWRARRK